MRELLAVGDRLISIGARGDSQYRTGKQGVMSIGINRLPGPMGFYLVANVIFENDHPNVIIPLHMAEEIQVSNP
jgi:hypothetical protein